MTQTRICPKKMISIEFSGVLRLKTDHLISARRPDWVKI